MLIYHTYQSPHKRLIQRDKLVQCHWWITDLITKKKVNITEWLLTLIYEPISDFGLFKSSIRPMILEIKLKSFTFVWSQDLNLQTLQTGCQMHWLSMAIQYDVSLLLFSSSITFWGCSLTALLLLGFTCCHHVSDFFFVCFFYVSVRELEIVFWKERCKQICFPSVLC